MGHISRTPPPGWPSIRKAVIGTSPLISVPMIGIARVYSAVCASARPFFFFPPSHMGSAVCETPDLGRCRASRSPSETPAWKKQLFGLG